MAVNHMQEDDICRCSHHYREHARALGRGKRNYLCLMAGCACREFAKQEQAPLPPAAKALPTIPGFFL